MRARRWVQDVPVTASISFRSRWQAGIAADAVGEAAAFDDLPDDQSRHAQRQLAHALEQGQLDRRLGADADETADQHIAALLHAERRRNGKADRAQGLADALDDQPVTQIDRHADELQRQHHFEAAEEPGDEMVEAGEADARGVLVKRLNGLMQPGDVAERGPARLLGDAEESALDQPEKPDAL